MSGATFKLADAFVAFGVVVSDGVMTFDGPNPRMLTSATAAFTIHDVGKKVVVAGAGAAGADLTTKIKSLISATQVLLDDPANTTVGSADLSYVKGRYRLSTLLAGPDNDGNHYQIGTLRRLQFQLGELPGGSLYIGGPFVTPTSHGIHLQGGQSDDYAPSSSHLAPTTSDYLCSDTANQLVNICWQDDYNLSTPA